MLHVCSTSWTVNRQHLLAGAQPVAFGSLEMDGTEGDDVNGVIVYFMPRFCSYCYAYA